MEAAIFGQAIREYLRPKRLLPWILLSGLCLVLAYCWHMLDNKANAGETYAAVSSMLVFRLLALASAIFTTAIITQEVEQKTIVYLLTRPVPRWKLLLVRYVASVLVVALVGGFAALLTSWGAYKGFGGNALLANDLTALAMGALAYGAVFLFISLLFNRALIICALYAFGWEATIPNMPGGMSRLSIFSYLQAIGEHPSAGDNKGMAILTGELGNSDITRSQAFTVLIGVIVVALVVSSLWFRHFEYVPREDAE